MDPSNATRKTLELLTAPAFCVENGVVTTANPAAQQMLLTPGTPIESLIPNARDEYSAFHEGVLYLDLIWHGGSYGASVTRIANDDVFLLEKSSAPEQLQALALAARELRRPLSGIMTIADSLLPAAAQWGNGTLQEQTAQLNQGLYQMLRIISNMSDAARYLCEPSFRPETRDVCAVLTEILEQAAALSESAHVEFRIHIPKERLYCPVDVQLLERAILNLVSNALKFTPSGGWISIDAAKAGNKLRITVADSGCGIPSTLQGSVFFRYLRAPAIEDSRCGIGLGMVLVRAAAIAHGGTVLVVQPEGVGPRITMTLSLEQKNTALCSPILKVDYAGERPHSLIELSDCLSYENYAPGECI